LHEEAEARRVANLFTITKSHREIWTFVIERPELARVLSAKPGIEKRPITEAERRFVLFLILHLASSFEARKHGMFFFVHGLRRDVYEFFQLPIPRAVWTDFHRYQEPDFVRFVEEVTSRTMG